MLDVLMALPILLIFALPMLFIALLVKLEDGEEVFYRQERIGRDGRPFHLIKFRSMVVGAEHKGAGIRVMEHDSRVSGIGRFLRKTSLDELPQLFNVIKGDISIVGPRPGLRFQVDLYDENQRGRLLVRPGITGWAQVNGRNTIDWERRIQLDLEYIRRLSLAMDLLVLLKTIPTVLYSSDVIATSDYWGDKLRARTAQRHEGEEVKESTPSSGDPVDPAD